LSGGERARLALALITRDAPHLLILDEPTNHLDVDAREALVQALNAYTGAVILISHDRHMVELTADRLVLVDGGTAREYAGSMDDYIDFILGRKPKGEGVKGNSAGNSAGSKPGAPKTMAEARYAQSQLEKADNVLARASAEVERLDAQIVAASRAAQGQAGAKLQDLLTARAKAADALAAAEQAWMAAGTVVEALEQA
ncbi:MAG: ABC transporter ATP-binding protein, partial [Erythrobacter sp.]|nr:ABC transporter ATP-binding protein [Erythrobacter sp.]